MNEDIQMVGRALRAHTHTAADYNTATGYQVYASPTDDALYQRYMTTTQMPVEWMSNTDTLRVTYPAGGAVHINDAHGNNVSVNNGGTVTTETVGHTTVNWAGIARQHVEAMRVTNEVQELLEQTARAMDEPEGAPAVPAPPTQGRGWIRPTNHYAYPPATFAEPPTFVAVPADRIAREAYDAGVAAAEALNNEGATVNANTVLPTDHTYAPTYQLDRFGRPVGVQVREVRAPTDEELAQANRDREAYMRNLDEMMNSVLRDALIGEGNRNLYGQVFGKKAKAAVDTSVDPKCLEPIDEEMTFI
jgi:hypothetical protein